MQDRKRPKSLETKVYQKLWNLEHLSYTRADSWKKSYRYTLINEFREHITFAKNSYMDHMVMGDIGIVNKKEWSQIAGLIDSIRVELTKLINSLIAKGAGGSESLDFGIESVSAGNKDA